MAEELNLIGVYEVIKDDVYPDGVQRERRQYYVTVRPEFGREFTVWMMPHIGPRGGVKWKTCRAKNSRNWYQIHNSFETAVKSANYRVRRYLKDHSQPFGIQVRSTN